MRNPDFMSNDDDLDDFQPYALLDFGDDDIPPEDDILALPLSYMTNPALDTPDIHVDHVDEDLADGEVFNIAILVVSPFVVSVVAISHDSDSLESMTSYALQTVVLGAYPTDYAFPMVPATPTLTSTPPHTPMRSCHDHNLHSYQTD
ncbi:hypothetical protein Hanom_Chr11g01025261 [Helianthus anomalus]